VFDGRTAKGLQPVGCALSEFPLRIEGRPLRIEDGMVQVDISGTVSPAVSADRCP
jgi:hypothetical protein